MKNHLSDYITIRKGCVDMWNAFMVDGADFTLGSDIPICPCTAQIPKGTLITFIEAKKIYKSKIKTDKDFKVDSIVHFYIDDQKFDGKQDGIWVKPYKALEILRHFVGIITPDFSTCADFPDPIKRYNTYRMRAFGRWVSSQGIPAINNVRWGTEETWEYCFDGIPYNSIVSIGTVASGIRMKNNRPLFKDGLYKMVEVINPRCILVYGSSNYECFNRLSDSGIQIISFPSQTSLAFSARKDGDHYE